MGGTATKPRARRLLTALNTRWHKAALGVFLAIVLAHWVEHLLQAFQVYVLGWERHEAGGGLGLVFPVLVHSELLHYGYALVMLVGLLVLLPGFTGRSRTWWLVALWLQVWHHLEHLLLFAQAWAGRNLFGSPVPVSIAQLVIPRVELHLLYNAVVFAPMVVAMLLHRRPSPAERAVMQCGCARRARAPQLAGV
jgi:hypothetical protein